MRRVSVLAVVALGLMAAGEPPIALPEGFWFTTFPAGGGGKVRGAQLKAAGLKPGVPDILVCGGYEDISHNVHQKDVLWLELKAKDGTLSQVQKSCHAELKALAAEHGYSDVVAA